MKRYRLKKERKRMIQDILIGASVTALTIWCLHSFWIAFIYGIQW